MFFKGDEAASFTKEEMQQGKHTEYEKNLHEELAMSSTVSSAPTTTDSSSMITTNSSSNSGNTSVALPPAASNRDEQQPPPQPPVQATQANGRATSEHSDKFSSRTPSPHQMVNGGWPNLGMDNNIIKKSRYI